MKIEIVKCNIIYSGKKQDREIDFVYLIWRETIGIVNKRKFKYDQLKQNTILFNAFRKYHPELFV